MKQTIRLWRHGEFHRDRFVAQTQKKFRLKVDISTRFHSMEQLVRLVAKGNVCPVQLQRVTNSLGTGSKNLFLAVLEKKKEAIYEKFKENNCKVDGSSNDGYVVSGNCVCGNNKYHPVRHFECRGILYQ